jgi:lipopolysaccharide biosynthesis glycosyltransferase
MEKASAGMIMNFVEIMLGEKLKDADPALDIMGSDRKVLQVACQDFTNYLKFHWNLIGKEANQCELVERLEKLFKEDTAELEAFLTVWTGIWFKKWKERVKLLIGNQNANKWNKMSKTLSDAEPLWRKIEHKQELQEVVIATLIKNGEVCGTEILAENLLKMELGEKNLQNVNDKDRLFTTLNNSLRKAREMAQSRGPLIFVKVDKGYYSALNE